jgi:hypothetical protein
MLIPRPSVVHRPITPPRNHDHVDYDPSIPLAWVESPLQLLAAAEWADGQDEPIVVAHRLTGPQMEKTAAELIARGARFAACLPYFGIPWHLLARHRHWAVGDAFSGQFRMAASLNAPRRLTLLDDGAQTTEIVDALLGLAAYARPRVRESAMASMLGGLVRDRMLGLAARGRLDIATAFPLGDARVAALESRGITVRPHRLDWVRRTARPIAVPGDRVLLGSALPVDGRVKTESYLAWVGAEARDGGLAYLPHRRETPELLRAVKALPGVQVYDLGLPVELVLAGAQSPLEVIALQTSAQTTLGYLLEGSGSSIRTGTVLRDIAR